MDKVLTGYFTGMHFKRGKYSLVIALVNSICTSAAVSHACFGWNRIEHVKWVVCFLFSFMAAYAFFALSEHVHFNSAGSVSADSVTGIRRILIVAGMLFICWLPYLFIYAPGLVNYDTVNQINDFLNGVSAVPFGYVAGQEEVTVLFNAHHPVFLTLVFGAFIKLGIIIGKPAAGLTLYIVLQMIAAALIFSYVIEKAFDRGNRKIPILKKAMICFFAFFPVIPYYVCNMLKNSVHALLSVLYIFLFLNVAVNERMLSGKEKTAWVVLSILVALTQNTGVYLVVITGIFFAITCKTVRRTAICGTLITAALMFVILPKIIYPAFNIFPGGKQEMIGMLFQQTARYVRDYPEEITKEDKEIISKVVDFDTLQNDFAFETTDNVKAVYNLHATGKELRDYYALWLRQGFKHPGAYFRATLTICGMFFAAGYDIGIFDHIPTNEGIFSRIQQINPESLYTSITEEYYWIRSCPLVSIFFQHALYVVWIPAICIYLQRVIRKKKNMLFIVPFVVNMLFLVMSPMVYSRYALSMIFTSPILLYMMILQGGIDSGKECEIV